MFEHANTLNFPSLIQKNLASGRVYEIASGKDEGRVYPSITRVLGFSPKPALEAWKKRVGPAEAGRIVSIASNKGTNIHRLSECYLSNQTLPNFSPTVGELWSYLKPVLDRHVNRIYAMEQDVYSTTLKVAGRMDLLAEWDSDFAVVDLKNSRAPKKEEWDSMQSYFQQGAFYALATYELTGHLPKKIVIPMVNPTGIQVFEARTVEHMNGLAEKIKYFYQNATIADFDL